jgi:hypothetical protein
LAWRRSLNRLAGNLTGALLLGPDIAAKRLELLHKVVNRKTATALGLEIPPSIMLRASEVIE